MEKKIEDYLHLYLGCECEYNYFGIEDNIPTDEIGFTLSKGDEINSILRVALRFLDEEKLIVLRDALIERTPKPPQPESESVLLEALEKILSHKGCSVMEVDPEECFHVIFKQATEAITKYKQQQ